MKALFFIFVLGLAGVAVAQAPLQDFTLQNVADGKMISLSSYPTYAGVVILFTSNACPFDTYYRDRIKSLIDLYPGKIQFLLVNAFIEQQEDIEKMKLKFRDWNVPYLADKEQNAMVCLGAHKSPEAFLIQNAGGKYFTVYSGAIDDNPQVARDVKQPYLKNAIDRLLAGQKIETKVSRAMGCSIRKK